MSGYRVWIISDSPLSPNSIGKVTLLIASGLALRGHDVAVVAYSLAHFPTPVSWRIVFNPRKWAQSCNDPLAELMPDVEIHVYPWGRMYDIYHLFSAMSRRPDVVFFYGYPYVELDINDIAYRYFTSKGTPSIVYALHEGPDLSPEQAISVFAHSVVTAPTRFVLEQYIDGIRRAVSVLWDRSIEGIEEYFYVLPHPVNTDIYSPGSGRLIGEVLGLPERVVGRDFVIGMVAKNHVRKDYLALVDAVFRVRRETGLDIAAGLYWIDSVSGSYWSLDKLRARVKSKHGVSDEEFNDAVLLLPDMYRSLGLTESMLVYVYTKLLDMHLFLTRGEAFGLPPVESFLLGVPTASTDIPPQREVFGDRVRLVGADVDEEDDYVIWKPRVDDAAAAVREFLDGGLSARDASDLRERLDYRRVAKSLEEIIELALRSPRSISEKIGVGVAVR